MKLKDWLKSYQRPLIRLAVASTVLTAAMPANAQTKEKTTTVSKQNATLKKPPHSEERVKYFISRIDSITKNILKKKLERWEGNIPHLYLDIGGKIHTGIGLNVDRWEDFSKLEFKNAKGKFLTKQEKHAFYLKVVKYRETLMKSKDFKGFKKYAAGFYKKSFAYTPTPESRDNLYNARIQSAMSDVKKAFGEQAYYNLHCDAQTEALQKHFQLGLSGFEKYVKYIRAAKDLNYGNMAKESDINGVSASRNEASRKALLSCQKKRWFRFGDWMTYYKVQRGNQKMKLASFQKNDRRI